MIKFLFLLFSSLYAYELSICAIFQNEAQFIKEWIEFHKIQGVEHFYLYNNNSTDNYLDVLQPYLTSQTVTLVDWPYTYQPGRTDDWKAIQHKAYDNCLLKYKTQNSWIAFIDLDEFLFCPNGTDLPTFLQPYKIYGGLCVNWLMFGTSNLEELPSNQTMIESLIHCAPLTDHRRLRGKSIVFTKHVRACVDAHTFSYLKPFYAVDANHNKTPTAMTLSHQLHDQIRINHYWTRTESWFRANKIPSRNNRRFHETPERLIERSVYYNQSVDTAILRYVPQLRHNMGLE